MVDGVGGSFSSIYSYYSDDKNGLISSVNQQQTDLSKSLDSLQGKKGDELSAALASVNFQVGQYNALMELTSNLGKNMADTLKSICQKV